MRRYNDYELIYMYKSENCEIALNILIKKYHPLMYKTIYRYGTSSLYVDDYLQEAILMLYQSILLFNERYNKTFTRYFELLLSRKIMLLQKRIPKYELHEDVYQYGSKKEEEIDIDFLTDFEKEIFEMYFVKNQKISFIASKTNKTNKQIYNTIYHIREKYKKYML